MNRAPYETAVANRQDIYRIRRCISHPSGPIFRAQYLHRRNSAGAKKVGIYRRELSDDVSFGIDILLVVEQSKTAPGVCDIPRRAV